MTDIPGDDMDPRKIAQAEEFLARFAASRVEPVLDEMTSGFTVEHARRILASPSDLKHFMAVAERTRPGRGWLGVAAQESERGRLNRQLLSHALAARQQPKGVYVVDIGDECTILRPSWWTPELSPEQQAPVRVDGGWIIHDPWDITKAPAVQVLDGHDAWWLPEVVGEEAAVALVERHATAAIPIEQPAPEAAVIARLALGTWLRRWHPGSGSRRRPFDEGLLQLELGLLAWQGQYFFATAAPARRLLENLGPTVGDRFARVQEWSGWRRRLADDVMGLVIRAYLETVPEDVLGHEGVSRLREFLLHAEAQVSADDLAGFRMPVSQGDLALAAGGDPGTMGAEMHGDAGVDPLQLPPRSVAAIRRPVVWEWEEAPEGILRITVAPGENPVDTLVARVLVADDKRIDATLTLEGGAYVGWCPLDAVPSGMVIDVCSPEFAVPPRSMQNAEASRTAIAHLVGMRAEVFAGDHLAELGIDVAEAPDRPFLAEIAAWEANR